MLEADGTKYGLLLNRDAKLHRRYFNEMCRLIGIKVIYRAPKKNKHYTTYAEIDSNYQSPMLVSCIFDDHPQQATLKKMGWVTELSESNSIIHVPYDLQDIQQGALFIVPSGLDNASGRLFKVVRIVNSIVYPSSLSCEITPEYEDSLVSSTITDYSDSSLNMLRKENDNLLYEGVK